MSNIIGYSYNPNTYTNYYDASSAGSTGSASSVQTYNGEEFIWTSSKEEANGKNGKTLWTVDTMINKFIKGDLSINNVRQLLNVATENGILSNVNEVSDSKTGMYCITFTYNGKNYSMRCNMKAAESGIDNITVTTYSESLLTKIYKFTDKIINRYFMVATEGGITKYILKDGYNL